MAKLFNITLPAENTSLKLHPKQKATVSYTVTNLTGRQVRGRAVLKPDDPAVKNKWVALVGEVEKDFDEKASTFQFPINVNLPTGAAPGKYTFRLDAVNAAIPDEGDTGPTVGLEILGQEKSKSPKWIIPLIIVVVLAVAGLTAWLLLSKHDVKTAKDDSSTPSSTTGNPTTGNPTPTPRTSGPAPSPAPLKAFTPLTLLNGWTNAPFSTSVAAVEELAGIVYFKGAIASGNGQAFVLPAGFRPATDVYVAVDLCNGAKGRLHITPSGPVDIQAENGALNNAQCFTSLDGASFAPADAGFAPLPLINGWTNAPFGTSNAAIQNINGIVHFKGAIASGNGQAFVLPLGFRPATDVYVPVNLCNATKGRLHLTPGGTVDIQAKGGAFNNAKCFTSLDGASFAPADPGFTPLPLINGWANAPFSTSNAEVQNINGIVHFKGAIASGNGQSFVLPSGLRPATDVYVPVDLCNGNSGRLHITPSGPVDIQAEGGAFSNAQCFTSLDGASFAR